MSPHQIIISVFVAHGLGPNLIEDLEEVLLDRLSPTTREWWLSPLDAEESSKYQALVDQISGPQASAVAQRELVMRGLLLKLCGGKKAEADDAWGRLTVLLQHCN